MIYYLLGSIYKNLYKPLHIIDEAAVHKLGNSVTWYIPLGLKNWFVKRGVENVIELDWWQEVHHSPDIMIACVPAMVCKH
jgi:N-acyl-phosphatidylethanolamine-hydrolysing phospholipase D